jgi:ABC-2 type transport system permease protein
MDRIAAILDREWREAMKNGQIIAAVVATSLVFSGIPVVLMWVMGHAGSSLPPGQDPRQAVPPGALANPAFAHLHGGELIQAFFGSQLMAMFLIAPVAIPMLIASYSVVGEKRERTLEPLLATPVTVPELLTAKACAAVAPGLLASWIGFLIYAVAARAVALTPAVYAAIMRPAWLAAVFLIAPLLALLSAITGLMASSRASDPRGAQSVGSVLILPVVMLVPAQLSGAVVVSIPSVLAAGLVLAAVDGLLLFFAVKLFQREAILTRWK